MGTSGTPLQYVIVDRLGTHVSTVRQYHSDLSDQSVLKIRIRIRVGLRVHNMLDDYQNTKLYVKHSSNQGCKRDVAV